MISFSKMIISKVVATVTCMIMWNYWRYIQGWIARSPEAGVNAKGHDIDNCDQKYLHCSLDQWEKILNKCPPHSSVLRFHKEQVNIDSYL